MKKYLHICLESIKNVYYFAKYFIWKKVMCNSLKNNILNRKICIIAFLLSIFLAQSGISLSANDGVDRGKSYFICKSGSSIKIKESSQLIVKSNLKIESSIVGGGDLVMNSDENSSIDATAQSIENLVLLSEKNIELISDLKIVNSLKILRGNLVLNDYSLYLNWNTKVDMNSYQSIIRNGIGDIITQYNANQAENSFHSSKNISSYFSVSMLVVNKNMSVNEICCIPYSLSILDRPKDVPVPPPSFL